MTSSPAGGPPARRPVELPAVVGQHGPHRFALPSGRGLLTLILLATLAWSLLQIEWREGFFRTNGLEVLLNFAASVVRPDLSSSTLTRAFNASWITVVYAVTGLTVALAIGFPLGVLASGVLASTAAGRNTSITVGRAVLGWMRAVHELVWAWLLVVAIGLSPFAAIFAIGIPYAGILGRIFADLLNDVPPHPLRALRATGAGELKTLLYGRLPMAFPDMASYTFYRFECALRASAIMGFVGLGGLGFQIQIALADLRYSIAVTFLGALILLIAAVEAWSSLVRRELVR